MEEPIIKGSNDDDENKPSNTDNIDTNPLLDQPQPQSQQQLTPLQKEVQDILETDLSCAICQDVYINPLILNCSHSFCKFCVFRWLSRKTGCPQCRLLVQFQAENLALRNVIVKLLLKTSPQFQKNRINSVNQRLKDEDELEKDDKSKIVIPKRSSNLSRAFTQNGANIAEYVSSMFPTSSSTSTSGRTPNSGASDTSEHSSTAHFSYTSPTNGYIIRRYHNRRNTNDEDDDDDYSDDEDGDEDDDDNSDAGGVDDDATENDDDEELDNQWLANARAIIAHNDDELEDGSVDDNDDEEHDETYDPNETVDVESLDQSSSESDDDDEFDASFVVMDISEDADASHSSIEIDDDEDDSSDSDDDEQVSNGYDDGYSHTAASPASPVTLCSMEEDSNDSDDSDVRNSDTNSDWDDGDRVQYLMSYFQDDCSTDSSTTIEYGDDSDSSDDF